MTMKINQIIGLLIFFLFSNSTLGHQYFVSITELVYNEDKNRIEGSVKITAHDFEDLLSEKFDRKINLDHESDSSEVATYFKKYLFDHITISSGGVLGKPTYVGKEVTLRQDLYFYFIVENIQHPEDIKVSNKLLFERFEEQQNIVHYRYKQQTKSVTLISSKFHSRITFE